MANVIRHRDLSIMTVVEHHCWQAQFRGWRLNGWRRLSAAGMGVGNMASFQLEEQLLVLRREDNGVETGYILNGTY